VTKIKFFSIEQLVVAQLFNKSLTFSGAIKIHSRISDLQSAESTPEKPFVQHNINIRVRYKVIEPMFSSSGMYPASSGK
jgi:hypothetical protein